ncbi:MAG: protein jag [Oscillospiraceae bacterium]|nr:protein jag [Oscillospiraceae bacterium]
MTEIFKAKTVDEAKNEASKKFGVSIDKIDFKVIKEAKKGFLGLGSAFAEVEATYMPCTAEDDTKPSESFTDEISENKIESDEIKPEVKSEEVNEELPLVQNESETVKENNNIDISEPVADDKDINNNDDEFSLDKFTLIDSSDDSLLNPKTKIARDYIISVLNAIGIDVTTKIYQNETGAFIELESSSNGTIIGRRGETLDAIQYLSSMIANKNNKEYFRITIDCYGYREKRKATLEQLASKMAKNALKTGRPQPLEPMNPYERRVIHSVISEIEGVSSRSVGEEPYRKVIISSLNPKKKNDRNVKGGKNFNNRNSKNNKKRTPREPKAIDLSTSFEKDYKKPKPEDSIEGGLYGKIEF